MADLNHSKSDDVCPSDLVKYTWYFVIVELCYTSKMSLTFYLAF